MGRKVRSMSFADVMASRDVAQVIAGEKAPVHTKAETLEFTRWLKGTGIKAKEVNELTDSFMASHYLCTNPRGQMAVPTVEQFDKMRRHPALRSVPKRIDKIVYGDRNV